MRFNTLDDWLNWQASLNPAEIDLGLERIGDVLQRMGLSNQFECPCIMVAGTNGKGSVVALMEAMATAAGQCVCSYTSPHISSYNERIRINGDLIDDDSLCQAFERIDKARGESQLTYFEFGTLAAIDIFLRAKPDLVIMEVGLGGRLDAVNIMEPDVSVIMPIAVDHTDWLGDDRETIAIEKAGILRENKPAVCCDTELPATLLDIAKQKSVQLFQLGNNFSIQQHQETWDLLSPFGSIKTLPRPSLEGEFQQENAATAIIALQALTSKLVISADAIRQGLGTARLQGRYDILNQSPRVIADVAHNPHAVTSLVKQLQVDPVAGRTLIVIAMLADKPVEQVVDLLLPITDQWFVAGLEKESRGLPANDMAAIINSRLVAHGGADVKLCAESKVESAIAEAMSAAKLEDRVVILGSFFTVAAAIHYFS